MPIYEYACEDCGSREERIQPLGAPEAHDCPSCSAPAGMKRRVSRTAFILSGEGWFAGGYGDGGGAKAAEGGTPGKASEAAGCEGGCACHAPSAPAGTAPEAAPGKS